MTTLRGAIFHRRLVREMSAIRMVLSERSESKGKQRADQKKSLAIRLLPSTNGERRSFSRRLAELLRGSVCDFGITSELARGIRCISVVRFNPTTGRI